MTFTAYPTQNVPDNLVGSLIRIKPNGANRVVVRDDGENGLWIAQPTNTAKMYKIPRDEYRNRWELLATEIPASVLNSMGGTFDSRNIPLREVNLDANMHTNMPEETKEEMPQVETDREAMKNEILDADVTDNTMTGHPVGGNEEPAATQEENREDPDALDPDGNASAGSDDPDDAEGHMAKVPSGIAKVPAGESEGNGE